MDISPSYFRTPTGWIAEHRVSPYFRFEADDLWDLWQTVQRAAAFYRRCRKAPEQP